MDILSIVGLGLVVAAIAVVLRQHRPEFALLLSIAAGAFLLFQIVSMLTPVVEEMRGMMGSTDMPAEFAGILFRALAICFLTQIACDICKDSGESAISAKIEMAGKVAVLAVSLPLFRQVLAIVRSLVG
jgi:stage III sporulation protein AD